MELNVNGNLFAAEATEEDIHLGLVQLTGDGDSFAILGVDEMTYIQTSGWPQAGFDLEYQAGSVEEHFRCTDANVSLDMVRQAFNAYLSEDDSYLSSCKWERIEI